MRARVSSLLLPILLMIGCATVPAERISQDRSKFGPDRTFTGLLVLGFERQSFNECWLEFSGTASADLRRLAPSPGIADERVGYAADVTLTGHMVNATEESSGRQGYGHMDRYPCLIEATSITTARLR